MIKRWVPEDYIYESAAECLEKHPEQAAALVVSELEYNVLVAKHELMRDAAQHSGKERDLAEDVIRTLEGYLLSTGNNIELRRKLLKEIDLYFKRRSYQVL